MVDVMRACARAFALACVYVCVRIFVRASRITDTDGYARQEPEMTEIAGNVEPRNQEIRSMTLTKRASETCTAAQSSIPSPILPTRFSGREYTQEDRELGEVSLACQTRLLSF